MACCILTVVEKEKSLGSFVETRQKSPSQLERETPQEARAEENMYGK